MKTIIFSDVHLGIRIDQKKFDFLKKIIQRADRVIINGDFWEGFGITFDEFISSPWKKLFPLLKSKRAVYIYGNHDAKDLADKRVGLFSVKQTSQYKLRLGKKVFIIEHGDRLSPMIDVVLFNEIFGINPPEILNWSFNYIEGFFIKIFGKEFLKRTYSRFNSKIKKKLKEMGVQKNEAYVLGHTHFAEIDEKNHLINSGIIKHGLGQYIVIDDKGKVELKEEKYR